MWWSALALLAGFYGNLVEDPAELRFCAAAGEVEAKGETDPDGAALHALVGRHFLLRLADIGAMDRTALDAAKAAYSGRGEDRARYEHCQSLALSVPDGGTLVDAAAQLDHDMEEPGPAPEVDGAPLLAALSEPRRREVRCATIASAIIYDVGRGVSERSYGLTAEGAETLAGRLAETIIAETGMSEAQVRAAYKADFEAFTFGMLGDGQDERTALATVEAGIDRCRTLYDSIDLSVGGDGVVKGLAPAALVAGEAAPTTGQCYAMLTSFQRGMAKGSKEAAAFGVMTTGLVQRFHREWGDRPGAAAALAEEAAGFDAAALEALPEEQAEARMRACFDLAAAD